jgi:Ankyrin repeats (3 copies)/Ankyrin repeat
MIEADIIDALNDLPEGLDETYQRILSRIGPKRSRKPKIARKALTWLCFAKRPLTLQALAEAAVFDPEDKNIGTKAKLSKDEDLLEILGSLVKFNDASKRVELSHFSVFEYLTSVHLRDGLEAAREWYIDKKTGHGELLQCCLAFLSSPQFDRVAPKFAGYELLEYATFHWPLHGKELEEQKHVALIAEFLNYPPNEQYFRWWQRFRRQDFVWRFPWVANPLGFYYASGFGLCSGLEMLMRVNAPVHEKRAIFGQALLPAAQQGNAPVVQLLLSDDADITMHDANGRAALHHAAWNGHEKVVEMLLKVETMDVTMQSTHGLTALHYAAWTGHEKVVEMLLKVETMDVTIQTKEGWTALHCAARHGHEKVVEMLLKVETMDVTMQNKRGRTALHYARNKNVVEMLKVAERRRTAVEDV